MSKITPIRWFLPLFSLCLVACAAPTTSQGVDRRAYDAMARGTKIEMRLEDGGKIAKIEVYQVPQEQVPAAVQKLAQEQLPGGKLKAYEYEVLADGSEVFEIEMTMPDNLTCEVSATAQGQLRYRECELAIDKAPDAIKKAALAVVSGEIVEIEQKQGPGVDEFSVEIKAGADVHKIKLNPAGQVTGRFRKVPAQVVIPAR